MIRRAEHNDNYMQISNDTVRDARLSFEARGFLVFILSMADDWSFSIKGLMAQTGLKRSVVLKLIGELRDAGYIYIKQETGKGGIFTAKTWEIYEVFTEVRFDRSRSTPKSVKTDHGENTPKSVLTVVGDDRSRKTPTSENTEVGENEPIKKTILERKTNIERNTKEKEGRNFVPPSAEEVRAYCQERGNHVDPEAFVDFYTSKGWMVGKNKMKDWKAAVRTWEKDDRQEAQKPQTIQRSANPFTELKRREGII